MPKGEPRTEEQAQEMKRFLEQGAIVSLEPIARASSASAELIPPQSISLEIDATSALEKLGDRSGEQEGGGGTTVERVSILELEFQPPKVAPEYSITLFINKRDVNLGMSIEDPSFAGSVAFFCHGELSEGELVCMAHNEEPVIFRLPAKPNALDTSEGEPLIVTLLPVPLDERTPEQPLNVVATLEIARSEFVAPE
jgi:hypothetical protein